MNNLFLNKAQKLYLLSKKELNQAKKKKDEELARNAAGKAWIAAADALRVYLLLQGVPDEKLPKNEHERHDLLAKYGNEKMWRLYFAIRGEVHEAAYYDGIINYTLLFEAFANVDKFIRHCEKNEK